MRLSIRQYETFQCLKYHQDVNHDRCCSRGKLCLVRQKRFPEEAEMVKNATFLDKDKRLVHFTGEDYKRFIELMLNPLEIENPLYNPL